METKSLYFPSLDSTNLYCKEHWTELGPFSFVRTGVQTAGKGRYQRKWIAEPNTNLLFSFLLQSKALFGSVGKISLAVAATVVKALEEVGLKDVAIKWPNDIYVSGKKVCGILLEGSLPDYIVVGIGLNVNQTSFPGEYRHEPSSLALEAGHPFDLEDLYSRLQKAIVAELSKPSIGDEPFAYYQTHSYLEGRTVNFEYEGQNKQGQVVGVDDEYRLLVDTAKGQLSLTGEVSLEVSNFSKEND